MSEPQWIGAVASEIEQRGEWWWPTDDHTARPAILQESIRHIPWALSYAKGGVCIQAGGNVGVYPHLLSPHFDTVLTFEPDEHNYACLWRNLVNRAQNVRHHHAALGEEDGYCVVKPVHAHNCGAHVIELTAEGVPVRTIDGLDVKPSLIWLDIEGHELPALKGAQRTLDACSPTIILEVKGLGPDPSAWLEAQGYSHVSSLNNDRLYQRV